MAILMGIIGWFILALSLTVAYSAGRNANRRGLVASVILGIIAGLIFASVLTDIL